MNTPPEIAKLKAYYQAAELKIIRIIERQRIRGNSTRFRESILKSIRAEIAALDKYAEAFVRDEIPKAYAEGARRAYEAFRDANVSIEAFNYAALRTLQQSAYSLFAEAHAHIGRSVGDMIRQISIEQIAEKLTIGDTVKQTQAKLVQRLSGQGITAITDRRGRQINLSSYAETVARSTTREATNTATLEETQANGHDLVQMTSIGSTCPICAPLEGRVYSISGNDTRYPPLGRAFGSGYANIHPNCRHNLTPYFEEFDDDADKTRDSSNRSFNIDPRTRSQKDAYDKAVKKKAEIRADRSQYTKYKAMFPDDAPKTFSGFRSMKRADSEKYRELVNDGRTVTRLTSAL